MRLLTLVASVLLASSCNANAQAFDPHDPRSPLHLVSTIALPNVKGRIDHMAIDPARDHLFVAEYGNGSVDEIDLASGKAVGRITGLREPQGVAWLSRQQEIAIASGDGLVSFYRGRDREKIAVLRLGSDADNVRVDARNGDLIVGYGDGALAVIDPTTHRLVRELMLPGHPEAFELIGSRVFVNVPDAHKIIVGDLDHGQIIKRLSTGMHLGNFPMASDLPGSRIAVAFRVPGSVSVLDATTGTTISSAPTCADADDLYFRAKQLLVVCGSGAVELINGPKLHQNASVTTQPGARTGLLDMSHGRLFVAVPKASGPASIWVLKFS